jgi:hypothetical protein
MAVERTGNPYEIRDEPPIVGASKFAVPIRATDTTWQIPFRNVLEARYERAALQVDHRTIEKLEFREAAIVFMLLVDQLSALPQVLDAVDEAIGEANAMVSAQQEQQAAAEARAKEAREAAHNKVDGILAEWSQEHPPTNG